MIGKVLDRRYQITKILGQGGFGQTFLAQDTKRPGNPICVVKQLKPSFSDPELLNKARELFNREAEVLQKLGEHDRIPRLLAYFEEENEFYLIQEYIKGKTLDQELIPDKPITEEKAITIVRELLEILSFVHSHDVIHRDIKPANIIRREGDRQLVLIDFGVVKRITTGEQQPTIIIGTPGYMPIEQLKGEPNFSSDLYAVGMICIQALTGIKPKPCVGGGFIIDSELDILWQQGTQVSKPLAKILTKMLRCNYRERYLSAKEALEDIHIQEQSNSLQVMETIIEAQETNIPIKRTKIFIFSLLFTATLTGIAGIKLWQANSSTTKLSLKGKQVTSVIDSQNTCNFLLENIFCEQYIFTGKKGQQVTIEMNSKDFDPYLVLQTSDGEKLAINGDISPQNWNAKVTADLPSDGKYLVIARTSYEGEIGNYNIQAFVRD